MYFRTFEFLTSDWDVKNLYDWEKLPVNNFEWFKDTFQFNEDYNEESDKGYFLKVDVQYTEKLHEIIMVYRFYQKESKFKMLKGW